MLDIDGQAEGEGTADRSITSETVEAIDHVRGVGNIGAHMEKDINQIVEVDPGEALALIELVEMLFEEWYVARDTRKTKLARISAIASDKEAKRKSDGSDGEEAQTASEDTQTSHVNALLAITQPQRKS